MKQAKVQTFNQPQRSATVDIIRVLLAFMILTGHTWADGYSFLHSNATFAGYIAVEAFFMISGFFLVKSATKPEATSCWKYTFRRIWDYLPLLLIIFIISIFIFIVTSLSYLEPFYLPLTTAWGAWFMWAMFFAGLILFAIWKKAKTKFAIPALILGIGCYVSLYFIKPCITRFFSWETTFQTTLLMICTDLLRAFGGMLLGGVLFCLAKVIRKNNESKTIRWTITFFGIISATIALFFIYALPKTSFDFLVVALFFIMLFCVFSEKGILNQNLVLSVQTSKKLSRFSYVLYLDQFLIIYFFQVFWTHNMFLWNKMWWLVLYGVLTYVCSILITFLIMYLDKKVKQKIMVKFKKLNNI